MAGDGPDSLEILPPRHERPPGRAQRKNSATCRPMADRWLPPPKFPAWEPRAAATARAGDSPRRRPRASPWPLGRNSAASTSTRRSADSRWPATARKATATANAGTDRSLAKFAHTATERVSGIQKGNSTSGAGKAGREAPAQGFGHVRYERRTKPSKRGCVGSRPRACRAPIPSAAPPQLS